MHKTRYFSPGCDFCREFDFAASFAATIAASFAATFAASLILLRLML